MVGKVSFRWGIERRKMIVRVAVPTNHDTSRWSGASDPRAGRHSSWVTCGTGRTAARRPRQTRPHLTIYVQPRGASLTSASVRIQKHLWKSSERHGIASSAVAVCSKRDSVVDERGASTEKVHRPHERGRSSSPRLEAWTCPKATTLIGGARVSSHLRDQVACRRSPVGKRAGPG